MKLNYLPLLLMTGSAAAAASQDMAPKIATSIFPSNCIDLADGVYELQLIDDPDYPSVTLRCSNGYVILDSAMDAGLEAYFSSWDLWHRATAGPSNKEHPNWQEWYLPDGGLSAHRFLVAPDCGSCERVGNRQLYGEQTTYWMTGQFFGCYWLIKANDNCDLNYDTLDCYTCATDDRYVNDVTSASIAYKITDASTQDEYAKTGLCTHNVRPADHYVAETQELCTTSRTDLVRGSQNLKPSLGTNGQYCVCAQPSTVDYTEYFTIVRDSGGDGEDEEEEEQVEVARETENGMKNAREGPKVVLTIENSIEFYELQTNDESAKNRRYSNKDTNSDKSESQSTDKHTSIKEARGIAKHQDADSDSNSKTGNQDDTMTDSTNKYVELTQKDFEKGTYRITEGGYYKVMEDIIFDFNPSNDDFNAPFAYWPMVSQRDEYPGAQDYRDEYSFGFFAGITMEADYITLDLNGHSLAMSEYFYLQQAWFTIIELSQQYFLPGQSFGFFGSDPHFSSNIIIKDGILGLSSHHGIHGNSNTNVYVKDLVIKDFNTHGIQLNGFDNVILKNIEIGPSSEMSYFRGQWGVARVLARRWQHIADEVIDETIQFKGRDSDDQVTMQDIVNELSDTMEYGWNYVLDTYDIQLRKNAYDAKGTSGAGVQAVPKSKLLEHERRSNNNERHPKREVNDRNSIEILDNAKDLFLNPSGLPSAASIYGIFLNKFGASVFTYNLYSKQYSTTAVLDTITIHGLKHKMQEWPYFVAASLNDDDLGTATDEIKNPFFGPISADALFNEFPDFGNEYPSYKGNIITDGYIASTKFMKSSANSFQYLGAQCVLNDVMVDWATVSEEEAGDEDEKADEDDGKALNNFMQIGCNMDTMNHAGKGLLGIRVDSVDYIVFKDITIYDNHDSTPLGSDACGNYKEQTTTEDGMTIKRSGHFKQTEPIQTGFSGNMNQGIAISASKNVIFEGDINIFDLTSETGQVYGIAIWPNVDVSVNSATISINNLESGGTVAVKEYEYEQEPNGAPEVCGIRLYEQYNTFLSSIDVTNVNTQLEMTCMAGDYGCFGDSDTFSYAGIDIDGGNYVDVINHDKCKFRFEKSKERVEARRKEILLSDKLTKSKLSSNAVGKKAVSLGSKVIDLDEDDMISEENDSFLTVFYKFKFIWNDGSKSNVVTEVLFLIVFATLCLCVTYCFFRFCCLSTIFRRRERNSSGPGTNVDMRRSAGVNDTVNVNGSDIDSDANTSGDYTDTDTEADGNHISFFANNSATPSHLNISANSDYRINSTVCESSSLRKTEHGTTSGTDYQEL